MNRFFRRLPLLAKLMLIGFIPVCFLAYLTVQVYREKSEKLELFQDYKNYISESANINGLVDALQEERKFSFDYAMTRKMRQELVLQRPKTDALIARLQKSGDPAITGFTSYTNIGQIDTIRSQVDRFAMQPNGVMHFYSNTVFRINTLNTLPPGNTPFLHPVYKDLMAQKILSEMLTYLGIIRSNIYNVLHTRQYMIETMIGTVGTHDVYNSYELELLAKASPEVAAQYKEVRANSALKPTIQYIDTLFKRFSFDSSYTAAEWWKVSDEGSAALRNFQGTIWKRLNAKVDELYASEARDRKSTLIFLLLALASVVTMVCYIVYIISLSLRQLRRSAERISRGETGVHVEVETNDAIGVLAASISVIDKNSQALAEAATAIGKGDFSVPVRSRSDHDTLANALHQMQRELQQYSEKMEHLVALRTNELARSNEDLQRFAHVASHDLKEPMRKISTFSSILLDEQKELLTDRGKLYLQKIENASRRMMAMIEGVLAYSTVSSSEQPFQPVYLGRVISDVENDLELAIIQKEAKVICQNLPTVAGIPLLLHQLFFNLLNNALKFAQPDTPPIITIKTITGSDRQLGSGRTCVHIVVSDNGIGFDPAQAEHIFSVFTRLHTKDKFEGTGLGLALCKRIVERHGGEIYASSEAGHGASFHVLLPAGN
jgi:signal transduction histidine kinase